jgi:hypothetical protein
MGSWSSELERTERLSCFGSKIYLCEYGQHAVLQPMRSGCSVRNSRVYAVCVASRLRLEAIQASHRC